MAGLEEGTAAPRGTPAAGDFRFLGFIGALGLLIIAGGLGLIFGLSSYRQVLALGQIIYHENHYVRLVLPLTPGRFNLLRGVLLSAGLIGLVTSAYLWLTSQPTASLWAELHHGKARLSNWWRRLPQASKAVAGSVLALVVTARIWYFVYYPLGTDEVASYDYFVRKGLLAITSFYPIPNNHILLNILAWPLAQLGLSTRLVMRLPTLVLGTVGAVGGYVLLARLTGLRLAALVTGLVGLAPIWVYYGAVGRGYFLQFCLLQAGFFAVVELLRPATPYRHLAWLAFISSSVLGMYLIPTYAYPLAGLGLSLGTGLLGQRRWQQVAELALAGAIILLLTLLLYAPVGAISGWNRLVSNPYVMTRTPAQFWPTFRAVLYEKAAELFGFPLRVSGPLWLAMALLGGAAARRWLVAGPRCTAGLVAWVLVALPILLMMAQRVYAPTRVLLHLTFFACLLALLLANLPVWRRLPGRFQWLIIVGLIIIAGGFRLYWQQPNVRASRHETQQIEQAYGWLRAHRPARATPARVWLWSPFHELFFAHYAHENPAGLLLQSGRTAIPTSGYDFIVLARKGTTAAGVPQAPYQEAYRDELVVIYTASSASGK